MGARYSKIFDPHQCRAIVIFVANDIAGTKEDKTPDEVARLCRKVIEIIRVKHPDTPVFWIATTPTPSRWEVWPEISKANEMIKAVCEGQKNTYFITTAFAFINDKGQPARELFRDDSLHLNDKGYVVWTKIIRQELDSVLVN